MPTRCCSWDGRGSRWRICARSCEGLDLDPAEAEAALRERRYRDRVSRDVAGAEQSGVHATPTFFVGDQRLEGSWSRLAQLVPAMLARGSGPDRPAGG